MSTQYPDPESEAAARAAQIAAVSIALIEAVARLREERASLRLSDQDQNAVSMRAARLTDQAAATATWAPALDRRWLAQADTHALLDAWAPAAAWADTDPEAARALRAVESQLTRTHPAAMGSYRAAVAAGSSPTAAMQDAAISFAQDRQVTATTQASPDLAARAPRTTPPAHKPRRR
jgi:hypothetical protein